MLGWRIVQQAIDVREPKPLGCFTEQPAGDPLTAVGLVDEQIADIGPPFPPYHSPDVTDTRIDLDVAERRAAIPSSESGATGPNGPP